MQVSAAEGVHEPAVSAYRLPPATGVVWLAAFALCYVLLFVPRLDLGSVPMPFALRPGLLAPVLIFFLLLFVVSQARDLSFFAARQRRATAHWRGVDLEWRRNEESRRDNLVATVQAIARERFAFPNAANPDLRTYVNLPEPTLAIEPRGTGEKVFPDIVAVSYPGHYPVAIAQVESRETVTIEQAKHVWARLQNRDAPLYLYVPAGVLAQAKDYAKVVGLKNVKFRTWRWTPNGMLVREL